MAPGGSRTRWRTLTMGSSTAPLVPDKGCAGSQRLRHRDLAQAPDEARAIGFKLGAATDAAARRKHVHEIPARLVAAGPARAENGVAIGKQRGLDEEVAEGRVREVPAFRRQHDLGVAGQLDLAHGGAAVDHRDAAQLDVVFRRHGDLRVDVDGAVAAPDDRAVGTEGDLVVVWLDQRRLIGRRGRGRRTGAGRPTDRRPSPRARRCPWPDDRPNDDPRTIRSKENPLEWHDQPAQPDP